MKTIAIHSHKGGVGKTTIALLLGKYAALAGSKVCVADFDFIGSGMIDLFALEKHPDRDLYHYFQEVDPYAFDVEQLLGRYTDRDLGAQKLLVMCSQGDEMVNLLANERRYRRIQSKTEVLFGKLEKKGVDYLIIDCHPGLGFVSETVRPLATLNVYVTSPNRGDCFGLLKTLNVKQLDGPKSFLLINKADPSLRDLRAFRNLVERDVLVGTESQAVFPYLEYVGQNDRHFAAVPESDLLRELLYLGGTAKLPSIASEKPESSFFSKVLELA